MQQTSITKEQATMLATEMMIGLGALLEKQLYTLPTLQEKVCVKGGITGAGIDVLEKEVGDLFVHIFQKHMKNLTKKKKRCANKSIIFAMNKKILLNKTSQKQTLLGRYFCAMKKCARFHLSAVVL